MSISFIAGNSFISQGVAQYIPLSGGADYFVTNNLTQAGVSDPGANTGIKFEWWADQSPANGVIETFRTETSGYLNTTLLTNGALTYVSGYPMPGAPITGTAITAANPAVASATNSYSDGNVVLLTGTTGMRQISGMPFQISSVSDSAFTLLGLEASGFAAAATAFTARLLPNYQAVLPQYMFVTGVSQSAQAYVSLSVDPATYYAPGMKIRFDIPSSYGMSQLDGLHGVILDVDVESPPSGVSDYNLLVAINTSGFSPFAFPASAVSVVQQRFATIAPDGQASYYNFQNNTQYGYNFSLAPFRSAYEFPYMVLMAGANGPAGVASDIIEWAAYKYI